LLTIAPATTSAMEFVVERIDLRPIRQPKLTVTAIGEIQSGDTEKLKAAIAAVDNADVRDILFLLDSPGGSLAESLRMGDFIASLPAVVSAQVGSSERPSAICASACVYAFLAADYRYMGNEGRIGIHQFSVYDIELDGRQGAALGQTVSGILSEYIRKNRASPELFEAISGVGHDDIMWIPRDKLEEWRVVTNEVYDEQEKYLNIAGEIVLELTHIAVTGDSRIRLVCGERGVLGVAYLHEPELAAYGTFEVVVNDIAFEISEWEIMERGDYQVRIGFVLPSELVRAATYARSFGARVVVPSGHVFFGFQQTMREGLLTEFLHGCTTRLSSSNASQRRPRMQDLPATDFRGNDLTTNGIRRISFARCKEICLEYTQCRAVSYVQASSWCWPKGATSDRRSVRGVISAVKN
jgi:hypothetical protein